jgi:hypothetical protein
MEDYPEELVPGASPFDVGGTQLPAAVHEHSGAPGFFQGLHPHPQWTQDPLGPPQAPAGILKKDWLLKHRTRVPSAVVAFFWAGQVSDDHAQWLQACSDLENLK